MLIMIKRILFLSALSLSSTTVFAGGKDYTCSDLEFDNKNHTVLAGKNPTFSSVDDFLLFMKTIIIKDFPKKVAEKYYEDSKLKGVKNAYSASLDAYRIQLERMAEVDSAINEGASKAGGLGKYISELCSVAKDKNNLEVQNIFYTFISASNSDEARKYRSNP